MATHYIHEFSSLANFNMATRDRPNAFGIGVVSAALYPGQDSSAANVNFLINTQGDNRSVRLNSRDYTQTSGSSIGYQSKPNQTATTTGDVIGGEVSPRVNDAGSGALIALRADPVVKDATSARTVSAVRGLEINIDLPNAGSAYTFTNDVSAIRIFPDFGSGHTFSGVKAILEVAAPNTSNFDVLMEIESGNATWINTTASNGAQIGQILIRVGGTTREIPYYATS